MTASYGLHESRSGGFVMTTLRALTRRRLNAWGTLDRLMGSKEKEPGCQRRYADVPRLRLLFAGLQATCRQSAAATSDRAPAAAQQQADESWWHSGFPDWRML
ncbi:hypothetical protein [Candidatus Accumulibacter sp. ACC003]|uniref:hypothetical protein n=1 Tax=Candidatus Accumulibacter sp. ACC003 TaxID=2823334 RepID=UPI0025C55B85|nr:hypothetical protein [Candidatus Accumulibacter sp. ACC003]